MNKIDIFLLIVAAIGAWTGYKSGFTMAFFNLLSIILGIFLAFKLMGEGLIFLEAKFNIDRVVLPYISFFLIFIVVILLVRLIGKFIKDFISKTILGNVDMLFGAILGALKYLFLLSVLIWISESLDISPSSSLTNGSLFYDFTVGLAPTIAEGASYLFPVFEDIFRKY